MIMIELNLIDSSKVRSPLKDGARLFYKYSKALDRPREYITERGYYFSTPMLL